MFVAKMGLQFVVVKLERHFSAVKNVSCCVHTSDLKRFGMGVGGRGRGWLGLGWCGDRDRLYYF